MVSEKYVWLALPSQCCAVCSAQVPARGILPYLALQWTAVCVIPASLVSIQGTHLRTWHPDLHEQYHCLLAVEPEPGQRGSHWRLCLHHQGDDMPQQGFVC